MTDEPSGNWAAFYARIEQVADMALANNVSDGLAIVSINMLINAKGEPVAWVVGEAKRIEPSNHARDVLKRIIDGL